MLRFVQAAVEKGVSRNINTMDGIEVNQGYDAEGTLGPGHWTGQESECREDCGVLISASGPPEGHGGKGGSSEYRGNGRQLRWRELR